MTNLKAVNIGFNKFCGPAVLSILTGKSTDECANVIARINGQYSVAGVELNDLLKAADKLGFNSITEQSSGSLYRTLVSIVNKEGMYIVTIPMHFVCIEVKDKKIYFCDNHTKEPIPAASSARLGQEVLAIHKVIERVKTKEEIANDELDRIRAEIAKTRRRFEMEIEQAALEVIAIAKDISKAIGDVSYDEAKEAIIKEFANRVKLESFYEEYKGKL